MLIVLIIINTIFWINITIKAFEIRKKRAEVLSKPPAKDLEEYVLREVDRIFEEIGKEKYITYRMAKIFVGKETMLVTFLIISDAILIVIYFMMSPLYKKD